MEKFEYIITSERAHRRSDECENTFFSNTEYHVGDIIELDGIRWVVDEVIGKEKPICSYGKCINCTIGSCNTGKFAKTGDLNGYIAWMQMLDEAENILDSEYDDSEDFEDVI